MRVSCIMPTTPGRSWCLPLAVKWFQRQTFPPEKRELVIVNTGDPIRRPRGAPDSVRLFNLRQTPSLGEKHNLACRFARYEWIAKWDDDDWYAPHRLAKTLAVAEVSGADAVSIKSPVFHELTGARRTVIYDPPSDRKWIAGTTLLFRRELWEEHPFPDRDSGVDTIWGRGLLQDASPRAGFEGDRGVKAEVFWNAKGWTIAIMKDPEIAVMMEWGQRVGRKSGVSPSEFRPYEPSALEIMGDKDLSEYEKRLPRK